jgi:hypothetical protein
MKLSEFAEVREMVRLDDRRKSDEACRLEDLKVEVRNDDVRNRFDLVMPDGERYPMSEWASRQLLQTRLGIPLEFLADRCPAGMAQGLVDHFMSIEPPRALLVRLFKADAGTRVRAVLPGSYARFDNADILGVAGRIADEYGLKVERYRLDENYFHLRLVFGDEVDAGGPGLVDPHRFGVFFRNSEVGQGVPEAQFAIVRKICGNGLIGFQSEPLMRLHSSSLNSVSRDRLVDRFKEGLEGALQERGRVIETIRSAKGKKVKLADIAEEFRRIHREYGLSQRNLEIVRAAYHREARDPGSKTPTVFEIASALNRAAQHLPAEESIRYEEAAWDFLQDHAAN